MASGDKSSDDDPPAKCPTHSQAQDSLLAMMASLAVPAANSAEIPALTMDSAGTGGGVQLADAVSRVDDANDSPIAVKPALQSNGAVHMEHLVGAFAREQTAAEDETTSEAAAGSVSTASGELTKTDVAEQQLQRSGPAAQDRPCSPQDKVTGPSSFSPESRRQSVGKDLPKPDAATLATRSSETGNSLETNVVLGNRLAPLTNFAATMSTLQGPAEKASPLLASTGGRTVGRTFRNPMGGEKNPEQLEAEPAKPLISSLVGGLDGDSHEASASDEPPPEDDSSAPSVPGTHSLVASATRLTSPTSSREGGSPPAHSAPLVGSMAAHADELESVRGSVLSPLNSAQVLRRMEHAEIRIGLETEKFGPVRLHTSIKAELVGAVIDTSHPGLKAALVTEAPSLEKAMSLHRLQLQSLNFERSRLSSGSDGFGQQQQAPPHRASVPLPLAVNAERLRVASAAPGSGSSGSAYRLDVQA